MKRTLAEMDIGQTASIMRINAKGDIRRRLLDMGLLKNIRFKVVRVAPLGDPIEIIVKNLHVSLRKKEAETIIVDVNHIEKADTQS